MRSTRSRPASGFTLAELLVVIAVVGIIALLLLSIFYPRDVDSQRVARRMSSLTLRGG